MGKHHILISVHAPKQVLGVYGFCSPWIQCWFMCHWCKRSCLQYNGTFFSPHHESKWIRFQYSYMILEMITIPLWPNNNRQAELVSKDLSYAYSTECIERELIARSPVGSYGLFLQWGQCWLGFHPCIGRCPPQHSETCSIPTGEQMYLSSVFFTWLKKHSHLDITP